MQYGVRVATQRGWKAATLISTASIELFSTALQSTWNRYTTSESPWKKPTEGAGSPGGGGKSPSKSAGVRPLTSPKVMSTHCCGEAGSPASIRARSNAQILRASSRAVTDALTNMLYVA